MVLLSFQVVFVGLADEESSDEEDGLDPYGTANRDGIDGLGNEGKLPEELAQPEFEGLWNKTHKPYAVSTLCSRIIVIYI